MQYKNVCRSTPKVNPRLIDKSQPVDWLFSSLSFPKSHILSQEATAQWLFFTSVDDDDVLLGPAYLSAPQCARTTAVQIFALDDPFHLSFFFPRLLQQPKVFHRLHFCLLFKQQYFRQRILPGHPKPPLHVLQHRALSDKTYNCLFHSSTQWIIHRSSMKICLHFCLRVFVLYFNRMTAPRLLQYIPSSPMLTNLLYSCSVILFSTSLLHLSPFDLFPAPPIFFQLIVFRCEWFIPNLPIYSPACFIHLFDLISSVIFLNIPPSGPFRVLNIFCANVRFILISRRSPNSLSRRILTARKHRTWLQSPQT